MSRMDVLTDEELKELLKASKLIPKYNEVTDRESAYEMLTEKIEIANREEAKEKARKEQEAVQTTSSNRSSSSRRSTSNPWLKTLTSPTVIRSVLGILGKMMK